jgi:hypothetical protein
VDEGQGNQLVANCSDKDFELLIVFVETENFNESPSQADCDALDATEEGTVVMDLDYALNSAYGMKKNMGAGLVDGAGLWVSDPDFDDGSQGASYSAATSALMSEVGCSMWGGF